MIKCLYESLKDDTVHFQIRPIIDKVFKMEDLISAYEHVKKGRKRGKTIIDFSS